MLVYNVEITDTFGGEPNYAWVRRATVATPELTAYGYDGGQGYVGAHKRQRRVLVRRAKAAAGWTGVRCEVSEYGDGLEIRPRGMCQVAFITYRDQ